jgi:signal transduction histidine kinase
LYQPQVIANKISLRYDLCENSLVAIEANEFQQVIINLMNNAISSFNHCHPHKTDKAITVHTVRSDQSLLFIVSDNGAGIPAETEPKLFTLLQKSSKTGMGLGLWLSQHIVEQHRGTIRFERIPTGGTRFIVELPL